MYPPPSYPGAELLQAAAQSTQLSATTVLQENDKLAASKVKPGAVISEPTEISSLNLDNIIKKSTLLDKNPQQIVRNILAAYNEGNSENFTVESDLVGTRVDANQFMLIHKNNIPQLVGPTKNRVRLGIYPLSKMEIIEIANQTQLCIGAHGRYVVNVPQGQLAKAWLGTDTPILLGPGPHVIRHPNFKPEKLQTVSLSENYISHGNYHILRVPRGKIAKITIGATPHILEYSPTPYVFDDPTFTLNKTLFQDGTERMFMDANDKLIVHDSIKRIQPRNEVAIAYDHGVLNIVRPTGKPIIKDNPNYIVDGFLQTVAQTLVFPSEETQEKRRRENPKDLEGIKYEKFRTSDGLDVGVNLLVVYEIIEPEKTLARLKKDEIIKHIENIVVADMGRVIQSCNSADFQKSNQTSVKDPTKPDFNTPMFNQHGSPTFYAHLQDEVKNKLAEDLIDWGIRLVRLNIETPEILDKKIASEMSQNALETAKKRAEASNLDIEFMIKQQHANQEAEKKRIEMERERQNSIVDAEGKAQAKAIEAQGLLNAAKLKAEATTVEFEVKNKNDLTAIETNIKKVQLDNETAIKNTQMKNETELNAAKLRAEAAKIEFEQKNKNELAAIETARLKIQMENDAAVNLIKMKNQAELDKMQKELELRVKFMEQSAKVYADNEPFRLYEIAKAQAEALRGIATSVISPDVAQSWYSAPQGIGFFQTSRANPVNRLPSPARRETQDKVADREVSLKLTGTK